MIAERQPPVPGSVDILLVEDDDGDAKAVRRALRAASLDNPVIRAIDGRQALALLRGDEPSALRLPCIVLTDVNLPRMTGHDLVAAIRADPRLSGLVVFMVSTSDDPRDIDAAYRNHVAGYILKQDAGDRAGNLARLLDSYRHVVTLPGG